MTGIFKPDTFAAKYFSMKYLRGQEEATSGRSGWVRLFIAQLQEESLNADRKSKDAAAQPAAHDEALPAAGQDTGVAPSITFRKRRKKPISPEILAPEDERPPIRLKPLYQQHLVEIPDVGPIARESARDVDGWVRKFHAAMMEHKAMISRLRDRLERDVAKIRQRKKKRALVLMLAMT